jgi:hypothetical protein
MSRLYDENYNPMFQDDFADLVRQDRDAQDNNLDRIVREASHRREIMMAQKIIDENTLCLSGVDPCDMCRMDLDLQ